MFTYSPAYWYVPVLVDSQGLSAHPEDQNEEEKEENLRKIRETAGKWGKIEEMFLSKVILPTREWEAA